MQDTGELRFPGSTAASDTVPGTIDAAGRPENASGELRGVERRRSSPSLHEVRGYPGVRARLPGKGDSCGVALRVGRSNLRLALHADQPLAAGDYSGARRYSRLVRQRAHAAFWFTVAALLFFGIIYALDALSNPYVTVQPEVLQAVCYPRSSRERVCFSLRFGAPLVARRGRCC